MKHVKSFNNFVLIALASLIVMACDGDDDDNRSPSPDPTDTPTAEPTASGSPTPSPEPTMTPNIMMLSINLEGEQEVPMVDSPHTGVAEIQIDLEAMEFDASINTSTIDDMSAAHIHGGMIGENGDVVYAFADDDSDAIWTIENQAINQTELDAMLDGDYYINVHTATVPSGEIRGQIAGESKTVFTFLLTPEAEVPSVMSMASGEGYGLYDSSDNALMLKVITANVTATAAHIHNAPIGLNGGVAIGLEQDMGNANIWMAPMSAVLTAEQAAALTSAELYVNVHSDANPAGEIRGQMLLNHFASSLFPLDASQVTSAISSSATGTGYLALNTENGDLTLNVYTSGVTGTVAHIHEGALGADGGPVVTLMEDSATSGLWQAPSGTQLNQTQIATMLGEGHYVNIHSEAYPAGEIRGQIEFE